MNIQTSMPATPATSTAILRSDALFGDSKTLQIDHQGMTYTLRITRQGKLLLTK